MAGQAWRHRNLAMRILWPTGGVWIGRSLTGLATSQTRMEKWRSDLSAMLDQFTIDSAISYEITVLNDEVYWVRHLGSSIALKDINGVRFSVPSYDPNSSVRLSSCATGLVLMEYLFPNHCTVRFFDVSGTLLSSLTVPSPLDIIDIHAFEATSDKFVIAGFDLSSANYRVECYDMALNRLWFDESNGIFSTIVSAGVQPPFSFFCDLDTASSTGITRVIHPATGVSLLEQPSGAASFGTYAPEAQINYAFNGSDKLYIAWNGDTFLGPTYPQGFVEVYDVLVDTSNLANSTLTPSSVFTFPSTAQYARGVWLDRSNL